MKNHLSATSRKNFPHFTWKTIKASKAILILCSNKQKLIKWGKTAHELLNLYTKNEIGTYED